MRIEIGRVPQGEYQTPFSPIRVYGDEGNLLLEARMPIRAHMREHFMLDIITDNTKQGTPPRRISVGNKLRFINAVMDDELPYDTERSALMTEQSVQMIKDEENPAAYVDQFCETENLHKAYGDLILAAADAAFRETHKHFVGEKDSRGRLNNNTHFSIALKQRGVELLTAAGVMEARRDGHWPPELLPQAKNHREDGEEHERVGEPKPFQR